MLSGKGAEKVRSSGCALQVKADFILHEKGSSGCQFKTKFVPCNKGIAKVSSSNCKAKFVLNDKGNEKFK